MISTRDIADPELLRRRADVPAKSHVHHVGGLALSGHVGVQGHREALVSGCKVSRCHGEWEEFEDCAGECLGSVGAAHLHSLREGGRLAGCNLLVERGVWRRGGGRGPRVPHGARTARCCSGVHAQLPHLDRHVKQVVVAFAPAPEHLHALGPLPRVTPDVDAVPAHQHRTRVRVALHCLPHTCLGTQEDMHILDDGNHELFVVAVAHSRLALLDALQELDQTMAGRHLDHLLVGDPELWARAEECGQHGCLGVRVNHRTGTCMQGERPTPEGVGVHEEGGALAFAQLLVGGWPRQEALFQVLHKQVLGLDALLLYPGGGHAVGTRPVLVDPPETDAHAPSGAGHPSQVVELAAQLRNQVARVLLKRAAARGGQLVGRPGLLVSKLLRVALRLGLSLGRRPDEQHGEAGCRIALLAGLCDRLVAHFVHPLLKLLSDVAPVLAHLHVDAALHVVLNQRQRKLKQRLHILLDALRTVFAVLGHVLEDYLFGQRVRQQCTAVGQQDALSRAVSLSRHSLTHKLAPVSPPVLPRLFADGEQAGHLAALHLLFHEQDDLVVNVFGDGRLAAVSKARHPLRHNRVHRLRHLTVVFLLVARSQAIV
ncbi:unnamed protein product [Ixodes pacificus]